MSFEEENLSENVDEEDVEETGRRTQSMMAVDRRELQTDKIFTFWLHMNNTEYFDDITVFAVEFPVAEPKKVEVVAALMRELENLAKYDLFEEMADSGQDRISLRWVITK